MLYLAALGGQRAKAIDIALACDAPQSSVQQVLQALTRARLLGSNSSAAGGYELQVDPDEVSLLQIIEAVEGPIEGDRCVLTAHPCPFAAVCPVHRVWTAAVTAFADQLSGATLADVLGGGWPGTGATDALRPPEEAASEPAGPSAPF